MGLANLIINFAKEHGRPEHLDGYMERFWLIPFNPINIAARVHHLLRSDLDDVCHDHPWSYLTIILKGGYYEIRPIYNKSGLYLGEKKTWHGAGTILFRPHNSWHRLEVEEGLDTWTLFIMFRKKQKWGFLINPKNKVRYEEYLGLPHDSIEN